MKLNYTLIAVAAVMIATPVLAADQKGPKLDTNGDGKVTQGEFQAGRSAQMLALDSNKDGKLSRAEFAALGESRAKAKRERRADHMWARLDGDKDGVLSRAEMDGALMARFQRMDADKDGALTGSELKPGRDRKKVGL
jgi:hypothetical protein